MSSLHSVSIFPLGYVCVLFDIHWVCAHIPLLIRDAYFRIHLSFVCAVPRTLLIYDRNLSGVLCISSCVRIQRVYGILVDLLIYFWIPSTNDPIKNPTYVSSHSITPLIYVQNPFTSSKRYLKTHVLFIPLYNQIPESSFHISSRNPNICSRNHVPFISIWTYDFRSLLHIAWLFQATDEFVLFIHRGFFRRFLDHCVLLPVLSSTCGFHFLMICYDALIPLFFCVDAHIFPPHASYFHLIYLPHF